MGCIPVMIANNVEFPYEDWLDYSELTLKVGFFYVKVYASLPGCSYKVWHIRIYVCVFHICPSHRYPKAQ